MRLTVALLIAVSTAAFGPFSPAHAASEWTTGCDLGNGAVNGYNYQGSKPRTTCKGKKQRVVPFLIEVPGVKFGKRVRSLPEPGEFQLIRFGPFAVFLSHGEDGSCQMELRPDVEAEPLATPGPAGLSDLPIGPIALVAAGPGDIAGQIPTVEYVAVDGRSFRAEDLKVVADEDGCWGGGVFRYVPHPRGFHDPK